MIYTKKPHNRTKLYWCSALRSSIALRTDFCILRAEALTHDHYLSMQVSQHGFAPDPFKSCAKLRSVCR